jgi:hypothetical protein
VFDAQIGRAVPADTTDLIRIVVPLILLGVVAGVQEIRGRRWDPSFFRSGVIAYRKARPTPLTPGELRMPTAPTALLGTPIPAMRLSTHEIAFFAPVLNGSLMRGLLRYNSRSASLEVVGHLQWGLWALMGSMAFIGAPFPIGLGALVLWAYLGESRRFFRVLHEAHALLG